MTDEKILLYGLEKIPLNGIDFRTPNVFDGIVKIWRNPWPQNIRLSLKEYYVKYADGTNRPLYEICKEDPKMIEIIWQAIICQNCDDQWRWMAHTTVDRLCEMSEKYNIDACVVDYSIIDAIQKTFKEFELYEVPLKGYDNYLQKREDGAIVLYTGDEWPPFVVDFATKNPPSEDLARALGGLKRFLDKHCIWESTKDTFLRAAFDECWEEWHRAPVFQSTKSCYHPWVGRLANMGEKIVPYLKEKLDDNDLSATWVLNRIFPNKVDAQELVQPEKIINAWKQELSTWSEKEEKESDDKNC